MYLIEYTLVVGLVMVDQELGPLVLLTSHYWVLYGKFFMDSVFQDVPITPENMRQRIIDGCAAMNPQVTERSRQSSSNDCNSALTLTANI
jgi:hypothetical protein